MTTPTHSYTPVILTFLLIISLGAAGYLGYTTYTLQTDVQVLHTEKNAVIQEKNVLAQELVEAQETISAVSKTLNLTEEELSDLEDDYRAEKKKNDNFEDQIDSLLGTVSDLDKLSKTDEELLQKYSKVYFLNENYTPSNIAEIDEKYILEGRAPQFFHGDALPFLENMIDRAKRDDIDLKVLSAYRSFETQTQLKGAYTQTYGSGANAFSADQGYSEHQLGTTIDLTTAEINGPYLSFQNTEAYAWLLANAYKYGFTLSYPDNNSFYVFEPWHWRFVGEDLAGDLEDKNQHFYDIDQRTIDTYLLKIFD